MATDDLWWPLTATDKPTRPHHQVCFHPVDDQLVSCGYDKSVRLFDTAVGTEVRAFLGHELPVPGGVQRDGQPDRLRRQDATLFFWDERSALCVRKLRHSLGEVTSVQLSNCGMQLLVSSKDNAARLWDVRATRPLCAYKGHLNTCKNFVRARFGPGRDSVMSGSEDGSVCLWSLASAELLHRLRRHTDVVYDAVWNPSLGLLASCSQEGTVRTWRHDP
jgi:WD40 repeat protein